MAVMSYDEVIEFLEKYKFEPLPSDTASGKEWDEWFSKQMRKKTRKRIIKKTKRRKLKKPTISTLLD